MRKLGTGGLLGLAVCLPLMAITVVPVAVNARNARHAAIKDFAAVASEYFGSSVAISGATVVVGGGVGHLGRAYVFTKTAADWEEVATLKGTDTVAEDGFGYAVAISGPTIVVGAYAHDNFTGRAYVFTKTTAGWKQTAELLGTDTIANDEFGHSVAVWGDTIVVGTPSYPGRAGRVYIFNRVATGWRQTAVLRGDNTPTNSFGWAVAISGPAVVVGAQNDGVGRVYVFVNTPAGWKVTAVLNTVGSDFLLGRTVAFSGTEAMATADVGGGIGYLGKVYFFDKTAVGWRRVDIKTGFEANACSFTGMPVAVSGSTAMVGACSEADTAGRVHAYSDTATGWKQVAVLRGADTVSGDDFGSAMAMSGRVAVVTAPQHLNGAAYVFTTTTAGWVQVAELTNHSSVAGATPPTISLETPTVKGMTVRINGITLPTTRTASIVDITWKWGDDTISRSWFPASHTYAAAGTYKVIATATDSDGLSVSASTTVHIGA